MIVVCGCIVNKVANNTKALEKGLERCASDSKALLHPGYYFITAAVIVVSVVVVAALARLCNVYIERVCFHFCF